LFEAKIEKEHIINIWNLQAQSVREANADILDTGASRAATDAFSRPPLPQAMTGSTEIIESQEERSRKKLRAKQTRRSSTRTQHSSHTESSSDLFSASDSAAWMIQSHRSRLLQLCIARINRAMTRPAEIIESQ